MKSSAKAVIERSTEGKRERALGGMESRGDLPVRFRCGKCWLPVDSIRASSGFPRQGGGGRGEQKKEGVEVGIRKRKEERGRTGG